MALPLKGEINPKGATLEAKFEDLVRQLQRQSKELKIIVEDLYKNGYTPIKGTDHFTEEDKAEFVAYVLEEIRRDQDSH